MVTPAARQPAAQAGSATPTTWEEWRRFVDRKRPAPPSPEGPRRSAAQRLAYHSRFVVVRTPALDKITTSVRTLTLLGRHQDGTARPGLIVTGPPTTGKSTALQEVGRTYELHQRSLSRAPVPGRAPVAYILVPPGASAKSLAAEFARFVGLPVGPRMTQALLTTTVCSMYTSLGVSLVLVDEIHRLNPRTTGGAEAADFLKDLSERLPATFVYAGVDVTDTPLFSGVRGAQLAGRASLVDCDPLPARTGDQRPFRSTVAAFENALDLTAHRPGSLRRLAPYLHERTAGRIGSLSRLIREAAITAIVDGTEKITKTSLDAITLDHLAEEHHRPTHQARRRSPGPR
ncbi:ATP-binding protein [Kitasatospora sp. MBT66]|uniref:ATP-binding protein n=1 Tax=Kitasatospora sp. MBT66 TaxID=1444769 RepID=UPI0005B7A841|nr:ATP-binding protein [Kitasatospora sp. MBT66]